MAEIAAGKARMFVNKPDGSKTGLLALFFDADFFLTVSIARWACSVTVSSLCWQWLGR